MNMMPINMRPILCATVMILLVCAVPHTLFAAVYYVDHAGGNDAHEGTSLSNPWKHSPGDGNASMTPAATALQPGDRIVFKGGTAYKGSIRMRYSGTAEAPIIYDGNSDGAWGSGRAVITSFNELDASGSWTAMNADAGVRHVVIRGLHFKDIGGYADDDPIWSTTNAVTRPPGGAGIQFDNGGSHITIDDCIFEEIGQWINAIPMSGTLSISGSGVHFKGGTDIIITNCTFKRMKIGISIKVSTGTGGVAGPVLITGCNFTDHLVWGIDVAPNSAGVLLTDIVVENCNFYDYSQYDSGNWKGYGEKPHRDGIFFRTSGMNSHWSNIVVRGCKFWNDDPQSSKGGTASVYISQGPSVTIYNNVFLADPQANGHISIGGAKRTNDPQRVLIFNNTYVGPTRPIYISASCNADEITIKNNALYRQVTAINSGAMNLLVSSVGSFASDNNLFYADQTLSSWRVVYNGSYQTFEAWRGLGYDTSSMLADPLLVNLAGPPSAWDIRPLEGSPLIGAGADLSAFFAADIEGIARGTLWTIGAIQASSDSGDDQEADPPPPASPTGFRRLSVLTP